MREKARQIEKKARQVGRAGMRRRGSGWMGQQMINVEKANNKGESKTDRESVREKEKK